MKKLFAFVLAFLILFSGCGWNVEIVDPTEQTDRLEKQENEESKDNDTVTEEFVEEIVLNFGAEKEADGTYKVTEPFSFYRNTGGYEDFHVIDESANSLYGMGAMLGKEYLEEIYVSDLRYEVYNAEAFENMVYEYFGVSADILKNTIHYNEFEELGGAGYYWLQGPYYIEEDPVLIIESFKQTVDVIDICVTVDYENNEKDTEGILTVKLLAEGKYNYVSYFAEKIPVEEQPTEETIKDTLETETLDVTAESIDCWNRAVGATIFNNSDREIQLSAMWELYFEVNGNFEKLNCIRGIGYDETMIPIAQGENFEMGANTEGVYGLLPIGKYRQDYRIVFKDDAGTEKEQTVSAFFEITGLESYGSSFIWDKTAEFSRTVITLTFRNDTGHEIRYGEEYFIQRLEGEDWVTVEPINEPAFDMVLYTLDNIGDKFVEWSADLSHIYGELPKGKYRLVKTILADADNYINGKHYAFFEFEIE